MNIKIDSTDFEVVYVSDVRYYMEMRGGGDIWRIIAKAQNHPAVNPGEYVLPTNPKSYNKNTKRFTTNSGRVYEIVSFAQDQSEEKFEQQILKDIEKGGYEIH